MEIIVTALGPDHVGLADPIIHHITLLGANISEIQMYDHDEEAVFAMLLRLQLEVESLEPLRTHLTEIGESKGLSVRVWSLTSESDPDSRSAPPTGPNLLWHC